MEYQRNIIRFGFVFLLLVAYVYSETIHIKVGGNGGILKFDPQNSTAVKGDIIQWDFQGGNHNVVQSDGLSACDPSQNPNAFKSQTNPQSGNFVYNIVDEKATIYYFCSFTTHCQNGMWGAIYVGGTQPSSMASATPSATASSSSPSETSAKSASVSIKSGCDFKLITSFVVFALIKFLF